MLLEETPAVLSLESAARIMGKLTTGPAVKKTHLTKNGKKIETMCHSLSLVYRRVPLRRPHPLLHHLHHRILCLTPADSLKIQYPTEVEVRVRSYGETRSMNQQKRKLKNKNEGREEEQSDLSHEFLDWLQEFREHLVDESTSTEPWGKNQSKDVETLPSHLMNFQWSREQKWNRVRVSTVYKNALYEGPKLRYLLEDNNNEGLLQNTCWYSRAQSGKCWWLDNGGSQNSQ